MLLSMAAFLWEPSIAFAGSILGSAQSFAVLGAQTVTKTGTSTISGSLGTYPGTSLTGSPTVINGSIHLGDAVALQAQNDETYAYNTLAGLASAIDKSGTDLGGLTLFAGVYKFTSSAFLTGIIPLTLDFQNNPNSMFVFQIGSTLNVGNGASVVVTNGAASDGIYFQVGSSATLGTTSTFAGNILALASVTLNTGAKIECGRAFAQTGAVTMDTNSISNNCSLNDFGSGRSDFGSAGFSAGSSNIQLVTPEPGTFLLLGMSLFGIVVKFSARKK